MDGHERNGYGGDPACWAGAVPASPAARTTGTADLAALAAGVRAGAAWSVESADLDVNLVVFPSGDGVAEHVNAEVDVLLVGIRGGGTLEIDGLPHTLLPGHATIIPNGARRSVRAGTDGIAYLTCHRRRQALLPARPGGSG